MLDNTGPARERLIAVAIEEFGEKGFEGARVNEIAARANINKQLIFHYFKSKDGLYKVALEAAYLQYRGDEDALRAQIADVDAATALRRFALYLFQPTEFSLNFQRLIQDENRRGAATLRQLGNIRTAYQSLLEIVGEILARGAAEGRFRRDVDVQQFYISMVGLFGIRILNAQTFSVTLGVDLVSDAGREAAFDSALQLLVDALRP